MLLSHGQHRGTGDQPDEPAGTERRHNEGRLSDASPGIQATDDQNGDGSRIRDETPRVASQRRVSRDRFKEGTNPDIFVRALYGEWRFTDIERAMPYMTHEPDGPCPNVLGLE